MQQNGATTDLVKGNTNVQPRIKQIMTRDKFSFKGEFSPGQISPKVEIKERRRISL